MELKGCDGKENCHLHWELSHGVERVLTNKYILNKVWTWKNKFLFIIMANLNYTIFRKVTF
jgi:hypothetical protein